MAALPKIDGLIERIESAYAARADLTPRAHLGASVLGGPCERQLWYGFRWSGIDIQHDGRVLRLFARGQREEDVFFDLLRLAGAIVHTHADDGKQFRFQQSGLGGQLSGSLDGIISGLPEAPDKPHVLECKTHNSKSFHKLCKEAVKESKPEHYDQMQLYMHWTGLDRALYMAVNKDDDTLYIERVAADPERARQLVAKATRIIEAQNPPARISEDPAWYQCKFCNVAKICHGTALPVVNCRTCLHSTPLTGDRTDGAWHCAKWETEIPADEAAKAQNCHRYIPELVTFAECIDVYGTGDIVYECPNGEQFLNGETQPAYLSTELRAIDPEMFGKIEAIKEAFDGRVVKITGKPF